MVPQRFDLVVQGRALGDRRPRAVADAVEAWFRSEHPGLLTVSRTAADPSGAAAARIHLHPVDPGVRVSVGTDGTVVVRADCLPVGPGYHVFLAKALRRLGPAVDLAWEPPPRVSLMDASERAQERLMEAARAVIDRLGGADARHALMLPPHEEFEHDGLVATPLGPRDMHWLAAAAVGGLHLHEVFPWPEAGPTARVLRGRALSMMWTQVRWRPPQDAAERDVLSQVDQLLDAAWTAEPNLDLPWPEWAEVRALLGVEDDVSAEIARRGAEAPHTGPVGYRRRPVTSRLPAGWWITTPGELATRWADRATWQAADGERTVEVTVAGAGPRRATPLPRVAMTADQLVVEGGGWRGAAQFGMGGDGARLLEGRAVGPKGEARIWASMPASGDRRWAERVFRSLAWRGDPGS
jgi:hypothetical protein